MTTKLQLLSVIDDLNDAVNVCYNVDSSSDEPEKSYPFATGYSRAAMQHVVRNLQQIIEELQ